MVGAINPVGLRTPAATLPRPTPRRYLVEQGALAYMCQILINDQTDARVLEIVMDGLDKILKVGKMLAGAHDGNNPYALMVEVCCS
jgi:hypothetical protein